MDNSKRIIYIDVLKAIAIFSVIVIHTTVKGIMTYPIWSAEYCFTLFFSSLARFAVPIFVMCSGILFLNMEKGITTRSIYAKYIPRIVSALVVFALFYALFMLILGKAETGVFDLFYIQSTIKNLLTFNTHYHLYYLYIIIIIYALTPILRTYMKSATEKNILYLIGFLFTFFILVPFIRSFYPFNTYFTGMTTQYHINSIYGMLLYFVAGHYLNTYDINKKLRNALIILGIVGVGVTFFGTALMSYKCCYLYELFLGANTPNVFFSAIGLFLLVKNIRIKSRAVENAVVFISKSSFCIYLIHDAFLTLFAFFKFDILSITPFISLPLLVLAIFASSVVVYLILRKIPLISKIIN
ncbi:MAG: acyltransferase family protein [Clostridia bacterium]|nr:acyltransferase family protein [Clostridia bacterium]